MKQISLTFLQYYYLLKSLLFKLLLLNTRAKQAIAKRCSEDILFWLEFFVKLPPQNKYVEEHSRVPVRREDAHLSNHETKEGEALSDSLGSSPFLKGLGQEEDFFNKHETNTTSDKCNRGIEKGVPPFSDSLQRAGGGLEKSLPPEKKKESLSARIQRLKISFKPQTTYKTYFWLKYKKDYILELKERIENNKPLLVSKSANMDETTCTALVLLWFWLYKENANFYVLGQTAKHLYYTKDSHRIFNLYKYVLNHLPHCLFNTSTDPPKDKKQNKLPYTLIVNRKKKFFIKLTNLNNGNTIYGFSGAKRNYFPQHKQIKGVWLSNFAFHRKQQEHYQALKNISQCMITTSIPNGKGNLFYELSLNKELEHYKFHWLLNPHYDDIWYKKIVLNIDLNHIHQFLDIGFDYKIRRQRTAQIIKPVKKAAKKVEVVQATVRNHNSTFSKTFTATNTARKLYHRNAKSVYTPESYEASKKSLVNSSLRAMNIPVVRENSNDIVYLRWQKMNKLIRQNNYAQITSVQAALKVIYHYQPDLTAYLLQQPQMPKVNDKINNNYERIHFKTLFPYAISKNEIHNQPSTSKKDSRVHNRPEETFFDKQNAIDHINKLSVRKYNPNSGITSFAGETPLCDSHQNQPTLDLNNNQETSSTSTENVGKATGGGVCGKGHLPPFSKGLGDIENQPTSDLNNNQETNSTSTENVGKATEGGVCGKGHHATERGGTPLHPVDRAVGGCDNLIPETSINKKTKQFFEHYKKNRTYKVRSTKFNITIKPPKHKRNKSTGIDGSAVERGDAPLCGKGDHPPEEPP